MYSCHYVCRSVQDLGTGVGSYNVSSSCDGSRGADALSRAAPKLRTAIDDASGLEVASITEFRASDARTDGLCGGKPSQRRVLGRFEDRGTGGVVVAQVVTGS